MARVINVIEKMAYHRAVNKNVFGYNAISWQMESIQDGEAVESKEFVEQLQLKNSDRRPLFFFV